MNRRIMTIILALAALLFIQCGAVRVSYDTLGEIACSMTMVLFIVIDLTCVPIVLATRRLNAAAIILASVTLTVGAYQATLTWRWIAVDHESHRIVAFVQQEVDSHGNAPVDLVRYHPSPGSEWAMKYIHYERLHDRQFIVAYDVGDVGTSHWFDSRDHDWTYYPDWILVSAGCHTPPPRLAAVRQNRAPPAPRGDLTIAR